MKLSTSVSAFGAVLNGLILCCAGAVAPAEASAQAGATLPLQTVQVTATRFGERALDVPGSISVVSGEDIRARGATDLRMALALLGGVSVAPGGDAGPAAAVPELLGVREVDDLLLLIDGIPAGGAFVPQVEAISLNNVDRIEVIRGAAPVYFGTTAFAGTINVIHYAAGQADETLGLRVGSRGSRAVQGAIVLSDGAIKQSLSAEFSDDRPSDPRARAQRTQGSWRLGSTLGGGQARADLNLLALRQKPNSPMPLDEATGRFIDFLPIDYNQHPADARLDTDRVQLVLGYELPLELGRWGSTLTYTQTQTDSVLGSIDSEDTPQPWMPQTEAEFEAFAQSRRLRELFFDSHLTSRPADGLDLTVGGNVLLGRARADSLRYGLERVLDGLDPAPATQPDALKGRFHLQDRRNFLGLYLQTRYAVSERASLLAGVRWNSTRETRDSVRTNSVGATTPGSAEQNIHRLSGSLGAQWQALRSAAGPINALNLHASVGSTFQPAQIDFNPNPEAQAEGGGLLKPETQRSLVFGLKADALDGAAEFDVDAFVVDFRNQPTQATVGDATVLWSVGRQRYLGLDAEGLWRPAPGWTLKSQVTWSDATYRDFLTEVDGVPAQLSGRRQVLTPRWRGGAGLFYGVDRGWRASLLGQYVGRHWLDAANTVEAPAYAVVDASLGYRFEHVTLLLAAANLGNRRDAVQGSELSEGQFYRLTARRFELSLTLPIR